MNAPVQTAEARELALAGMGASRLRKEDARFIQGKGNYVDDIKMPGMLHMDIVRSPIAHGRIVKINTERALAMPGVHAVLTADAGAFAVVIEGVAEGLRQSQPDTRPFILTRSGFGGIQRASSALWSGDVAARWDDLRDQISAGLNLSLAGVPNWTHDIGGFAVEARYSNPAGMKPEDKAEWEELNLRWFQFGAFSPVFRSHGEFPLREVYNLAEPGTDLYAAFGDQMRLRYRLMPYIYTLAGDSWHRDGTIMRGLAMDFAADHKVLDINDQYLTDISTFGAYSWDRWGAGNGAYVAEVAANSDKLGALPMFTLYQMATCERDLCRMWPIR